MIYNDGCMGLRSVPVTLADGYLFAGASKLKIIQEIFHTRGSTYQPR